MSMSDIVGTIQNLTPPAGGLATTATTEALNKLHKYLVENRKVLVKVSGSTIDQVVDQVLPLPQFTLGHLHLLAAKVSNEVKNQNDLFTQIRRLLINGDVEQIAIAPNLLAVIARSFVDASIFSDKFVPAILPLQSGIQKMQGTNPHLLTPLHAQFALVCLKAKAYNAALPVLEQPLFEISKATGLEPIEYLQYFYYGGMLYCGLKKFAKALEFFQMALTAPSKALSAIQVEAYKKYICVSLIETGDVTPLPAKLTSGVVLRNVVRLASHYEAFARVYKANSGPDALLKSVSENVDVFRKDKNFGLVRQALDAAVRRNIRRLTSTYVTLSLAEIAHTANVKTTKEAEKFISSMIEDGVLFAQINQKDGMVIFQEQPDEYNSTAMIRQLDSKIQEIITLSDKLKAKEKDIVTNVKYIVKTTPSLTANLTAGATGGAPGPDKGSFGGGFGGAYGGAYGDEDIQMRMALDQSMHG